MDFLARSNLDLEFLVVAAVAPVKEKVFVKLCCDFLFYAGVVLEPISVDRVTSFTGDLFCASFLLEAKLEFFGDTTVLAAEIPVGDLTVLIVDRLLALSWRWFAIGFFAYF